MIAAKIPEEVMLRLLAWKDLVLGAVQLGMHRREWAYVGQRLNKLKAKGVAAPEGLQEWWTTTGQRLKEIKQRGKSLDVQDDQKKAKRGSPLRRESLAAGDEKTVRRDRGKVRQGLDDEEYVTIIRLRRLGGDVARRG